MIDNYPFKPGDWIMADDEFARVESIFPIHYEPYDIASAGNDVAVGDYKHTVVSYHSFCDLHGRLCSYKAHIKYLDYCDWLQPLTAAQHATLQHMTACKTQALARWQAKCQPASDYVTIYVDVAQGRGEAALSLLRKAARKLPSRFTYCDHVQPMLRAIGAVEADTATTAEPDKDYVSFELCYLLAEQDGRQLSFYKMRELDCSIGTSSSPLLTYEGVFVAMYQLVRLCCRQRGCEALGPLAERLKTASFALFNRDFKSDAIANDFYKHAPKTFYTPDSAYSTIAGFLVRNAATLGIEDFARQVSGRDEQVVRLYHQLLGV